MREVPEGYVDSVGKEGRGLTRCRPVPDGWQDTVDGHREALWRLVEVARGAAKAGDLAVLRDTAERARTRIVRGDNDLGGNLAPHIADVVAELDPLYDAAFPVEREDLTGLLAAPWPTAHRAALLAALLGEHAGHPPRGSDLVERAVAGADTDLLRLLVLSPLIDLSGHDPATVLDALHRAGALDAGVVERVFIDSGHTGGIVFGAPLPGAPPREPMACADAVRKHLDEIVWRWVTGPEPIGPHDLPAVPVPRGLRFVRVALDWPGDPRVADRLGVAELTDDDRAALLDLLRDRPEDQRRRAFGWRLEAGDAEALLPLFGLEPATSLFRLIRTMAEHPPVWVDRDAVFAAVGEAGQDGTRRLLELVPSAIVAACLGWNRVEVQKSVRHHSLQGIAAWGMLPLAPGETVLDRYLALRESAKKGAKLGPNRRHSHAAAVEVALAHLAQVAGMPDADRLEWDCEARIATASATEAAVGDYRLALRFDGADPAIVVSRAGRALRSVPAAVRADAAYRALREQQERLRDQARRMRTGLLERLVATAGTVSPEELAVLRSLPAGAAMLPNLLWRDGSGAIGPLDEVDTTGPLTAVHPVELYQRRLLAGRQEEIVRRRIRQPVRQAFRELYLPTPAEREAGDVSHRFAGQVVDGRVAAQLLSGRGWSTHGEYDDHQATRDAGALVAALRCDLHGWFGMPDVPVTVSDVRFLSDGEAVPLADVPPVVFSEVMRDLDLVVSVAGTGGGPAPESSPERTESRARVLAALIADLGLGRVTVDGTAAVVRGTRATYRVHLTSGSIHVEPGGYLCVVPASFGGTAHRNLFLPFADEDRTTSVILSKVLLLAEDEKITDPSILTQLDALTGRG